MASRKTVLARAERLREAGIRLPFAVGDCIGRSFADLGTEEFMLIGERRMVSLFTGQVADLPVEHDKFFFRVPDPDQVIEELSRRGVVIEALRFVEQRQWRLQVAKEGQPLEFQGEMLLETLLDALLACAVATSEDKSKPRLRAQAL